MPKRKKLEPPLPDEPFSRGTPVFAVFDRDGEISKYPGIYRGKTARHGMMHFVSNKPTGKVGWCVDEEQIELQIPEIDELLR